MKFKALFVLAALLSTMTFANVAGAQTVTPTTAPAHHRGEGGSARNLISVRRRLERLIDQMQHDQHDYNGNRVKAISDLQAARADIVAALAWDASHPGQ